MFAPFRIRRRPAPTKLEMTDSDCAGDQEGDGGYDTYLSRLVKLIPAEVISLYLVGEGFIPPKERVILLAWTLVGIVAVVVVRSRTTSDTAANENVQWSAVAVSAVSYLIWVYSMGGVFALYGLHIAYVGSLLVLAWTFFMPYVYRGD